MEKKHILKLIRLYRENECLWKYDSPYYKRLDLKQLALKKIGEELRISSEDVKRKLKSLRSTYLGEKKKIDSSRKKAVNLENVYKTKLYYFDEMRFLDNVIVMRNIPNLNNDNNTSVQIENQNSQMSNQSFIKIENDDEILIEDDPISNEMLMQEEAEDNSEEDLNISYKTSPQHQERVRQPSEDYRHSKYDNVHNTPITILSNKTIQEEDVFSVFAKSIAMQLRQMPLNVSNLTMAEIQCIVSRKMATVLSGGEGSSYNISFPSI